MPISSATPPEIDALCRAALGSELLSAERIGVGRNSRVFKVVTEAGKWEWRRFADLRPGDMVPLAVGQLVGDPQPVSLPPLADSSHWKGEHHVTVPRQMSPLGRYSS